MYNSEKFSEPLDLSISANSSRLLLSGEQSRPQSYSAPQEPPTYSRAHALWNPYVHAPHIPPTQPRLVAPRESPKGDIMTPPISPKNAVFSGSSAEDSLLNNSEYRAFEKNALDALAERNGGSLMGNNPRMRRVVQTTNSSSTNETYRLQRERNNRAAKESRDRRKLREIQQSLKVSYLKAKVADLQARLDRMQCRHCGKSNRQH